MVRHDILMKTLYKKGLDERDVRIIEDLYYGQEAVVRVDGATTNPIKIR